MMSYRYLAIPSDTLAIPRDASRCTLSFTLQIGMAWHVMAWHVTWHVMAWYVMDKLYSFRPCITVG